MRISSAIVLGLATIYAGGSATRAGSLGVAGNYSEFVFNNASQSGVSQGQVAVGGNATFNNFTMGQGVTSSNIYGTNELVVGGNLGGSQANLSGVGNALYGSSSISNIYYSNGGTGAAGNSSSMFSSAQTYLQQESSSLAALTANGTTAVAWGGITLTGTNASLDVFNLSGATLSGANSLTINAPSSATVVVNIDGSSDSMQNFGFTLAGGITASQILYNFTNASSLTISGVGVQGSILATNAAVNFGNGTVNGSLIANSLSGGGTINDNLFTGTLPSSGASASPAAVGSVPEPSSIVMILTGGVLGLVPICRNRKVKTS